MAIEVIANLLRCEQDNLSFCEIETVVVCEPGVFEMYERHIGSPTLNASAVRRAGKSQPAAQAKKRNNYGQSNSLHHDAQQEVGPFSGAL
ncbi:MAG: hypothetical protein Q8L40_10360 [Burkholderiales bacterium]|nr:hypothetical protein [Burkholderiales bacterium]